jgi:hypothetical protein
VIPKMMREVLFHYQQKRAELWTQYGKEPVLCSHGGEPHRTLSVLLLHEGVVAAEACNPLVLQYHNPYFQLERNVLRPSKKVSYTHVHITSFNKMTRMTHIVGCVPLCALQLQPGATNCCLDPICAHPLEIESIDAYVQRTIEEAEAALIESIRACAIDVPIPTLNEVTSEERLSLDKLSVMQHIHLLKLRAGMYRGVYNPILDEVEGLKETSFLVWKNAMYDAFPKHIKAWKRMELSLVHSKLITSGYNTWVDTHSKEYMQTDAPTYIRTYLLGSVAPHSKRSHCESEPLDSDTICKFVCVPVLDWVPFGNLNDDHVLVDNGDIWMLAYGPAHVNFIWRAYIGGGLRPPRTPSGETKCDLPPCRPSMSGATEEGRSPSSTEGVRGGRSPPCSPCPPSWIVGPLLVTCILDMEVNWRALQSLVPPLYSDVRVVPIAHEDDRKPTIPSYDLQSDFPLNGIKWNQYAPPCLRWMQRQFKHTSEPLLKYPVLKMLAFSLGHLGYTFEHVCEHFMGTNGASEQQLDKLRVMWTNPAYTIGCDGYMDKNDFCMFTRNNGQAELKEMDGTSYGNQEINDIEDMGKDNSARCKCNRYMQRHKPVREHSIVTSSNLLHVVTKQVLHGLMISDSKAIEDVQT